MRHLAQSLALEGSAVLPNVGRESHSYLHHIVSRYDELAPWTVFTQATEPSWGYRGPGAGGGLTKPPAARMRSFSPGESGL